LILIDRTKVDPPGVLHEPNCKGLREQEQARLFYEKAVKQWQKKTSYEKARGKKKLAKSGKAKRIKTQNFEFEIYRDKEVKAKLAELFHNKCAYCEFRYVAGMTGDVEHYRPKGAIDTGGGESIWPGYYWLASDWENLLPSCRLCNSPNILIDLTDGMERTMGKSNFFPLEAGSPRATTKNELTIERPLILNPCRDAPGDHLEFFDRNGHKALLRGKTSMGKMTIDVCGLNRLELVKERVERLTQLEGLMADIQRAFQRLDRATSPVDREDFANEIQEKLKNLNEFKQPEKEYSALSSHEVDKFMKTLTR